MTSKTFFEAIEQHYHNELPFVVYKKGDKSRVKALMQSDDQLHLIKNFNESGFAMAPFDNENAPIIIPLENSKQIETDDYQANDIYESEEQFYSNSKDKRSHIDLVSKGIVAIKDKNFDKVVLSRKEEVEIEEDNPFVLFKKLLDSYPQAFVYCWFHPETGLWLGATPETLLQVENKRLTTMSLAGTKPYKGTLDVNWSEKEIHEQKIVTDYLIEQLDNQVDNLQISDTQTIQAGNLTHLKTMVTGILKPKENSLKNVIDKLHPTPAVCGFPRIKAKQFIHENENYNRAFYTGYLGELNFEKRQSRNRNHRNIENNAYSSVKKVTNLYVNLRCMKLVGNKSHVYVGGGITSDSVPEQEWEETVAKTATIKKVLQ